MTDNDVIEMIVSRCAAGKPFSVNKRQDGEWVKVMDFPIDAIKIVRERAIKEFAERVKEELTTGAGIMRVSALDIIDSLVKEMTEE